MMKPVTIERIKEHVLPLFFSNDSQRIFIWNRPFDCQSGSIKVWDTRTGELVDTFIGEHIGLAAISPDGNNFASLSSNETVKIIDISSKETVREGHIYDLEERPLPFTLHNEIFEFLTSLPNIYSNNEFRAFLNSAGLDQRLLTYINFDLPSAQFFHKLLPILNGYGMLRDGRNALKAVLESAKNSVGYPKRDEGDTLIQRFDEVLREEEHISSQYVNSPPKDFNVGSMPNRIAYSPNGHQIAIGYGDETARLWDIDSQEIVAKMVPKGAASGGTNKIAFSPDGRFIVGLNHDRIKIWDTTNNYELINEFGTVTQYLDTDMVITPDSTKLIWIDNVGGDTASSSITRIRVYDLLEQRESKIWGFNSTPRDDYYEMCVISSIDVSPDGKIIVAGGSFNKESHDDEISLWDIEAPSGILNNETSFFRFAKLFESIEYVRFSPDGRKLLSISNEREKQLHVSDHGDKYYTYPNTDKAFIRIWNPGNIHLLD